ncbi:transposase [Leptospira santarosai serovar Grippotyphosa]|nr:transposase [Leptospira santarosai serovar Guaricura]OLY65073.1 transposase [Leptospira santarosai serovar Grippotyphosa]
MERLLVWLQNFRRLVVRYEYYDFNFDGFIDLGCARVFLR